LVCVRYLDEPQACYAVAVDAPVEQTGHGLVAHLDEKPVWTVQVQRELLVSVARELVTSGLWQLAQRFQVRRSRDLVKTKPDLLGPLGPELPLQLRPVVEQRGISLAFKPEIHP
jgi:hypothetical protein